MISQKRTYFNHWFIVLGTLGCSGLLITLLCNTAGMFVTPVMEEFGWSRTTATLYLSIFNWIAAALQPVVGKIFSKYNMKPILLVVVIVFCGSYIWSGTFTQPWQWIVFGVIYGVCAGFFMYLPGPLLFSRWFSKKMAFAMSLGGVVTGVVSFFLNTMLNQDIQINGWSHARMVLGAITLAVCLLLTLLFVKNAPEDIGMKPYGADDPDCEEEKKIETNQLKGVSYNQVWKMPSFYMILVYGFLAIVLASFPQQVYSYAAAMPIGVDAAATIFSIMSIVTLFISPAVGLIHDRMGALKGNLVVCGVSAIGILLVVLGNGESKMLFYIGYGMFNLIMTSMGLGIPALVTFLYGMKDYERIYSKVTLVLLVSGGVANLIYAQLYDIAGNYNVFPVVVLILTLVSTALILLINMFLKPKKTESLPE